MMMGHMFQTVALISGMCGWTLALVILFESAVRPEAVQNGTCHYKTKDSFTMVRSYGFALLLL
jgi:hypothetical protein